MAGDAVLASALVGGLAPAPSGACQLANTVRVSRAELAPREDRLIAGMAQILAGILDDVTPDDCRDIAMLVTVMHEGITAQEIIHGAPAAAFRERIIPRVLTAVTTA